MQLPGSNKGSSHSYIDNTVLISFIEHMTMQHGNVQTGFADQAIITWTVYHTPISNLGFDLS